MVGDYEVVGKIAEGGMGTVYAGIHPVIGKRVAIKVMRRELGSVPEAADRFVQEARAVNQIGHPNIVDIFATGQLSDGRQYLVMERLEGRTLADRLDSGRMPHDEAIETLVQICNALEAAHAHDVIHRDLKPDNVFLAEEADHIRVVLLDFGIAKLLTGPALQEGLTTPGTMVGTPEYMSPEQARGEAIDARTDVYSLGAIAYEVFLEGAPFNGPSPMDTIAAMLAHPPDLPSVVWPDIPQRLEKLLLSMLSKQRELRPTLNTIISELSEVRAEIADRRNLGLGLAGIVRDRSDSYPTARVGMTSGPVPRITTTAMSTGAAHPRPSRWKSMALIGGLAAVAAVMLVMVLARSGEETAAASNAPAAIEESVAPEPAAAPVHEEPAAPTTGMVFISVNAEGARAVINGAEVDLTAGTPIELAAGVHALEIKADGYIGETHTIAVDAGGHATLELELEPAPQSHTVRKSDDDRKKRERSTRAKRTKKKKSAEKKADAPKRFDAEGTIDPFSTR